MKHTRNILIKISSSKIFIEINSDYTHTHTYIYKERERERSLNYTYSSLQKTIEHEVYFAGYVCLSCILLYFMHIYMHKKD